jgi:hypothetical protein
MLAESVACAIHRCGMDVIHTAHVELDPTAFAARHNACSRRTTMARALLFVSLAGLAGCNSLGQDVFPVIMSAEIVVDRDSPDELAQIDVAITFDADESADRIVELYQVVMLRTNSATPALSLAFPPDFDGRVRHGAEPQFSLANVGTTNGVLAPQCDLDPRQLSMFVNIQYAGTETYAFNDPEPFVFSCP